ncbi:uncharacterized protein [Clytia hemisphaerica]|uniref:PH domain-containing protein n=1 Tax=Clytia hemisphaerica TaxID=252671 RepID=A0A7M5VAF8_9CNID
MADAQFWKEGFLHKAGKHSFQGWRKRWFVLNSDALKYYNPGHEYNESTLLGVIQLIDIQSFVVLKSPKYAFEIVTKSRTYSMSAKSEMERDDWMITLRKASDEKRGMTTQRQSTVSSVSTGSTNSKAAEDNNVFKEKPKKKSSKKSKSKSLKSTSSEENVYASIPEANNTNDSEKQRASTIAEESLSSSTKEKVELKKRSSSVADTLTRANSALRKMSTATEDDTAVESIYQELDQELDNEVDSDESDIEGVDGAPTSCATPDLPLPFGGNQKYAFTEMKELFTDEQINEMMDIDLKKLSKQNKLSFDEKEEFPAFALLKSYAASLNK